MKPVKIFFGPGLGKTHTAKSLAASENTLYLGEMTMARILSKNLFSKVQPNTELIILDSVPVILFPILLDTVIQSNLQADIVIIMRGGEFKMPADPKILAQIELVEFTDLVGNSPEQSLADRWKFRPTEIAEFRDQLQAFCTRVGFGSSAEMLLESDPEKGLKKSIALNRVRNKIYKLDIAIMAYLSIDSPSN